MRKGKLSEETGGVRVDHGMLRLGTGKKGVYRRLMEVCWCGYFSFQGNKHGCSETIMGLKWGRLILAERMGVC